jgi:hypothetical protein
MFDLDDRVLDFILFRKNHYTKLFKLGLSELRTAINELLCCRAVCLNSVQAG